VSQEQLAEATVQLERLQLQGGASAVSPTVLASVPTIIVTTTTGAIVHPLFGEGLRSRHQQEHDGHAGADETYDEAYDEQGHEDSYDNEASYDDEAAE